MSMIGYGSRILEKIETLTSLRFFAAMMIVIYHCNDNLFQNIAFFKEFCLTQGVSFFFVLSGFILTYVYKNYKSFSYKNFIIARIARIWPLHFLITLLYLVIFYFDIIKDVFADKISLTIILSHFFLVHSWVPFMEFFMSLNSVSWSVSVEFFFYLLFPFLLINLEKNWISKLILSLLLVVVVVFYSIYYNLQPLNKVILGYFNLSRTSLLNFNPITRQFEFILGMITFIAYEAIKKVPKKLSTKSATIWELISIILVLLSLHISTKLEMLSGYFEEALLQYLNVAFSSVFFAFLIVIISLKKGKMSKILSNKIFIYLGEISYSIYLVHMFLMQIIKTYFPKFMELNNFLKISIYFSILIFISHISYKYIEVFFRRKIINIKLKYKYWGQVFTFSIFWKIY